MALFALAVPITNNYEAYKNLIFFKEVKFIQYPQSVHVVFGIIKGDL
jgi:hypothetical protein